MTSHRPMRLARRHAASLIASVTRARRGSGGPTPPRVDRPIPVGDPERDVKNETSKRLGIRVLLRDCHQDQRLDQATVIDCQAWTIALDAAAKNLKGIIELVLDDPPEVLADRRLDDRLQVENDHLVGGPDGKETKMFRVPTKIRRLDDEAIAW